MISGLILFAKNCAKDIPYAMQNSNATCVGIRQPFKKSNGVASSHRPGLRLVFRGMNRYGVRLPNACTTTKDECRLFKFFLLPQEIRN